MAKDFEFKPLHGSMFDNGTVFSGFWSEDGGAPTHKIAMQLADDQIVVAFNKKGSRSWTKAVVTKAVEDPVELAARAHKGYVTFKGHKLHVWLNYTTGHENEDEHARYDLKPRMQATRLL